ncbi:MAG: mechanosensitive ion channel [Woeseiaceae bacterium]|nr:mechanosensitive ion channel [Woeseiaceae bacterium]
MGNSSVSSVIEAHPEIAAIAVLVVGVVIARVASIAVGYGLGALDRRLSRITTSETGVLTPRLISLSRAFVFWLLLVLAVALAARVLGVGGGLAALNVEFIQFVPNVLIAFAIVVAGHLTGLLASSLLTQFNNQIPVDSVGPRLLHATIVAVAVVMGLQHIGVDITFITRLLLILVAISTGGLMLAFALGARQHVANLLAHREVSRLAIGERIRIDDIEGPILEITSTSVEITTPSGVASVPASRFAETHVMRLRGDTNDG